MKNLFKNILLKAIAVALIMPLYHVKSFFMSRK